MRRWRSQYFCSLSSLLLFVVLAVFIRDWHYYEMWNIADVYPKGAGVEVRGYNLAVVHGVVEVMWDLYPAKDNPELAGTVYSSVGVEHPGFYGRYEVPSGQHVFIDGTNALGFNFSHGISKYSPPVMIWHAFAVPLWSVAVLLLIPLSSNARRIFRTFRAGCMSVAARPK